MNEAPFNGGRVGRRRALAAGLTLAGCASSELVRGAVVALRANPLEIPAEDRVHGEIEVLGGLELRGGGGMGGLSAVLLEPDLRLTALTDRALVLTGQLVLDAQGRPVDFIDAALGPLGDEAGRPLQPGNSGDAEAMARLPDGRIVVAFERRHRLRAYRSGLGGPGVALSDPPGIERQPSNQGIEAMTTLPDGRLFAISEGLVRGRGWEMRVWVGGEAGWTGMWKRTVETFAVADATALPDGSVLVLERSFSALEWFRARLTVISAADIAAAREGTVLQGREIARFADGTLVENYEAVAALPQPDGSFRILLLSDDNFSLLQRSLLLWLAWRPGVAPQ